MHKTPKLTVSSKEWAKITEKMAGNYQSDKAALYPTMSILLTGLGPKLLISCKETFVHAPPGIGIGKEFLYTIEFESDEDASYFALKYM